MADIALIHGFATGLDVSVFRARKGADAGFGGFRRAIEEGRARAFRWDVAELVSFWRALSPLTYLNVYRREQAQIHSETTHEALKAFLQREQPRVIVCHSMGCALLLSFLARHALPASVRHVVFVQADIPGNTVLPSVENVAWHNLYCPWDPTLLASTVLHASLRGGLCGLGDAQAVNRLTPLLGINPHVASINDPSIEKWACSQLRGKI